jgi:tetratricopeptide (TPR) repeat protein
MGKEEELLKYYKEVGDWTSLRIHYFQKEDYDKVLEYACKDTNGLCVEGYEDLIEWLLEEDKYKFALFYIEEAINNEDILNAENGEKREYVLFLLKSKKALCLMWLERYEEAIVLYDELLENLEMQNYGHPQIKHELESSKGYCLQCLGRYGEALDCYDSDYWELDSIQKLETKRQKLMCLKAGKENAKE